MADGNLKTEISRNELENTASNVLFTQIADDGGNVASITGGKLDVNAVVSLETGYDDNSAFTIDSDKVNAQGFIVDDTATGAVTEGNIGLARMTTDRIVITDAQQRGVWDIGTVTTLTGITNDVNIADGGNTITVDGTVNAAQSGTWTIDSITNDVTVDATDLDIRDLSHTTDSVEIGDGTETLAINSNGSINVVPSVASTGDEVCDYDTATIAQSATSNHDYTVANTTFLLQQVSFGGSGRMKIEIQTGPVASLATKAVRFTKRDTSDDQVFRPALPVAATSTGTVRVIRTNRSAGSLDVYSTIMGNDI